MPYKPKWIYANRVRTLFVEEGQNLRIGGEAKDKVMEYLDKTVETAVKKLVATLPRRGRGLKKGELRRITLKLDDLNYLK